MLFAALDLVHRTVGRGRWRYQCGQARSGQDIVRAVESLPGVLAVRVNARIQALIIRFDASQTDHASLQSALLVLQPVPGQAAALALRAGQPEAGSLTSVVTALLTLLATQSLPASLKLPATLAASMPVLQHGAEEAVSNGLSSHVLEALAVGISIARQDYLAANTTSFMLALGEHLEDSIARHSDQMLKHLLVPGSTEIWVERPEGGEQLVPAEDVRVGDTVIVATGTVIPIDGTVLGGEGMVNESAMTGESVPQPKQRGDKVLSGTLMEEGRLQVYAEHVGTGTAAARIADYVEQSLNVKSNAQLGASRLADRLVPYVLGLAGVAYVGSGNWQRAAAVLQADYSCALKLATPVAFKSAMARAGRRNILVKGAAALERLAEADTFIFDKTGTLTSGTLAVTDSITFDSGFSEQDIIWLAASVEEHYFHPLAMAVVAAARSSKGRHFEHTEVEFVVAHGVASEVDGKRIVVGSRHFIEDDESISTEPYREVLDNLYHEGKTLLYIGYGGRLIGVLALKDSLRDNSAETVQRLRRLGVRRILMLTGDHQDRAEELAGKLGLDGFHAQLLPEDKARLIAGLAEEGARIAFIGDGINDAPALAGAHVGIAMQKGADISRLSADIALLEDNIACVADAKALAMATMQRINTNYRLAVGLNTAILGAASLGLLSPIATSTLHNGSTIAILLNALRGKHLVPRFRH